ncbi:hypothetical protein PMSD_08875 [Paenibacillus macquariensis subsp. defensor]|uniref:Uncharacterized protein n=1 Tax=Paenibacillus macquariensis TaxID=948756 RepID=A0ABY1K6W5_9BACL|nr:hypothetical protein [Paenibacillus macquariensis]MEC0092566.1 hypothetical protein [Paenibacillus macquariensis]OAB35517.1 hypothetical protein PMSM_09705 [Paenibacillus macquariensis subsp. macquariensis]OAB37660.1 hypothetical protein PMSD_08875 [Paenibacillus macquariensis subsp. defensor]SIR34453.1 hypothetical protein SAMN05421578_111100 [Paenibacillus macquariensis]
MKSIYSKAQMDYMKAKTVFEGRASVLEKTIEKTSKTREITQEVMEGLVLETGFHAAFNELLTAENNLIEWSHVTIKHEKTYRENKQPIESMYEQLNGSPEMRAQIIQLAMKIR